MRLLQVSGRCTEDDGQILSILFDLLHEVGELLGVDNVEKSWCKLLETEVQSGNNGRLCVGQELSE